MDLLRKLFPPANRDSFATRVCDLLRKQDRSWDPKYDSSSFKITLSDHHELFLANAYDEYLAAPIRQRRAVFARYLKFAYAMKGSDTPTYADTRANLLPKIRERFYHAALSLHAAIKDGKSPNIPTVLLTDDLTLELVHDSPTNMRTIPNGTLQEWGVTFEQAMAVARDNLWRQSNENFGSPQPGLYISPWKDAHDASRLVLHDLVWQLSVRGQHVAAVPNRDHLIVTGSDDVEGLLAIADLIEKEFKRPRFMTGRLVRLVGTRWEPYLPPIDHPAYARLREMQIRSESLEYAEQKSLLDKWYPKINRDVYVATHAVLAVGEKKKLVTWATWADGIASLLPRTDELAIARTGPDNQVQTLGMVKWDSITRVAGDLLTPEPDLYPPRYATNATPTAEQLAAAGMRPWPAKSAQST